MRLVLSGAYERTVALIEPEAQNAAHTNGKVPSGPAIRPRPEGPTTPFVWPLVIVALVALIVRLADALTYTPLLVGDPVYYHTQANLIASGKGFAEPFSFIFGGQIVPTAFHPPLYPLLLSIASAFGATTYTAHQVTGALIGVGTVVAIAFLGREVAGARRADRRRTRSRLPEPLAHRRVALVRGSRRRAHRTRVVRLLPLAATGDDRRSGVRGGCAGPRRPGPTGDAAAARTSRDSDRAAAEGSELEPPLPSGRRRSATHRRRPRALVHPQHHDVPSPRALLDQWRSRAVGDELQADVLHASVRIVGAAVLTIPGPGR